MDRTELRQLFAFFKPFNALSLEAENAIASICQSLHLKKNNDLQSIGHTCRTLYFINSGIARIYYFKDSIDITENFYFENSIIARAESLFTGLPSRKAIQILEDAELVGIPSARLFQLYDQFHDIERLFRKIIETAYVESIQRIENIQFHTAEERYKDLLREAPDILKRIPLKYIASYLGITQVSLSRIRSQR